MSDTPMDRIERHAENIAFLTALLVNKAHAAALVAIQFGKGIDEERFIATCRMAYQEAHRTVEESRRDYLAKMLPPEHASPAPSTGKGEPPVPVQQPPENDGGERT